MIKRITSAATMTFPNIENRVEGAQIVQLTPTIAGQLNFTPDGLPGQIYCLQILTVGTTSYVITLAGTVRSAGTITSGTTDARLFNVFLISDGQTYSELSRTTALA